MINRIFSLILFALTTFSLSAQQEVIALEDTLVIELAPFRGQAQWQKSADSETWIDIANATDDSLIVFIDFELSYFRAIITEGQCLPDTSQFIKVFVVQPSLCPKTISDVEGNIYPVIEIAGQCWMQTNLKTGVYRDQSVIPNIIEDGIWDSQTEGAWCNYSNNPEYDSVYGKLYNWYAAVDKRGICPLGWHVPTLSEFQQLVDSLGGDTIAGSLMKSTTPDWESPNSEVTNASGFTALPAGRRGFFSTDFDGLGVQAEFWTSSESSQTTGDDAFFIKLQKWSGDVYYFDYFAYWGISIRCKMDD